jgi:hypothetical protein
MKGDRRQAALATAHARIRSNPNAPLQLMGREADGLAALALTTALEQWRSAVDQHTNGSDRKTTADLTLRCDDLVGRLEALTAYDTLHDGALDAIATVTSISSDLTRPGSTSTGSTSANMRSALDSVNGWIETTTKPTKNSSSRTSATWTSTQTEVGRAGQQQRSAVQELLGLDVDDLLDDNGEYSPEVVLGAMHGLYPALLDLLLEIIQPLASNGLQLDRCLDAVHHFQLSDGPLRLWAAQQAKKHIVAAYEKDPKRTALIMRELRNRTDNSAANRERLRRTRRSLAAAQTSTERAELTLERYRQMAEGQLRPWGWTLARLTGGYDDAKMPELGGIRERLVKADTAATRAVADVIRPIARNAAAHEDYQYDDRRHVLRVGSETATREELEDACIRIVALVSGFELGFGAARADTEGLRQAMDDGDPAPMAAELLRRRSIEFFSTNGLKPLRGERTGSTFTVTIESLEPQKINPMFQAVMWASRMQHDTDTFAVKLYGESNPIVEVERAVLDKTFPLWWKCRHVFDQMPTGVFGGVNTAVRMKAETGPEAVRAAVWIGANDLVHAFNEFWDPWWPRRTSAFGDLAQRAYTVEHSSRIALEQTGNNSAGKLHQLILRASELHDAARQENLPLVRSQESRIRKLHGSVPMMPILPTWSDWIPPRDDD